MYLWIRHSQRLAIAQYETDWYPKIYNFSRLLTLLKMEKLHIKAFENRTLAKCMPCFAFLKDYFTELSQFFFYLKIFSTHYKWMWSFKTYFI